MCFYQEHPNELIVKVPDKPRQILRRGNDYVCKAAADATRTPFGHPEAFIEAFANIYLAVFAAIRDRIEDRSAPDDGYDFPGVDDGVAGMAFEDRFKRADGLGIALLSKQLFNRDQAAVGARRVDYGRSLPSQSR